MAVHASPLRIACRLNGSGAIVLVLYCAFAFVACSGEEPKPVANEPPPVDPRYASAEALIDHFNTLNSNQDTPFRTELELYYAENDLQRRMLRALEYTAYTDDLDRASRVAFGEPFDPGTELYPESAQLESVNGRRATAIATIIATGERRELHLVEIDGRWWLSGYTFEYDDDFNDPVYIEFLEELADKMRETVPRIVSRIQSGEFATVVEARQVILVEAVTEAMKELEANDSRRRQRPP